jgi:C1A family cysteine protease
MEGGAIPPSYDARTNFPGCFGDVQEMGNCSSSYAIAASEALAARFCIGDNAKYGSLRLSAQPILSCDKNSKGCDGGVIDGVWAYIQRKGLYTEECVPYLGEKGKDQKCSKSMTKCEESSKVKAIDHCILSKEKQIKREIYNKGPVVAPLYLKTDYLVYQSGVYTPTDVSEQVYGAKNDPINHGVSVLGWGKSQGTSYWIVRHSWGPGWGEEGYARVAMDTILRDNYVVVPTAGTEENIAIAEKKLADAEIQKEEEKKARAERDERIKKKQAEREAQKAAEKE